MCLLHTETLALKEFGDSDPPPYVILSHTWGEEEISFFDMKDGGDVYGFLPKKGFTKIAKFCALAKKHGFTYGWVDTCCIDKGSSAELSEAINSMYLYYYNAAECLVYLEDVPGKNERGVAGVDQLDAIKSSRWFTRGWTLQELVASKTRYFFAGDWSPIEEFEDLAGFNSVVARVTGIDEQVLRYRNTLSTFPIAQRMCWASRR